MGLEKADWLAIEARYLSKEKPQSIAADYPGLTVKQIYNKAHKEGWKKKKEEIVQAVHIAVQQHAIATAEENKSLAVKAINQALQRYLDDKLTRADLFILKDAIKLAYQHKELPGDGDEPPGFIVVPRA